MGHDYIDKVQNVIELKYIIQIIHYKLRFKKSEKEQEINEIN